jgi:heat shock protein HslJ
MDMRVLAAVFVMFLTACTPKNGPRAAAMPPAPAVAWSDLEGAPYTVESLTVDGREVGLPGERRPTMAFGADHRVSGMAGVNRYSAEGELKTENGWAWKGAPVATRMAGPPEAMAVEAAFLEAIQKVARIERRAGKLECSSADGRTKIVLTR